MMDFMCRVMFYTAIMYYTQLNWASVLLLFIGLTGINYMSFNDGYNRAIEEMQKAPTKKE